MSDLWDSSSTVIQWSLVAPHRERLVALVRPHCVSLEDAEDCVHDALVQVACHPSLVPARVPGLLSVVALRRAYDLARARGRKHLRLRALAANSDQPSSPEDIVLDRLQAGWVVNRSQALSGREREVFAHRAAGFTPGETAEVLNITPKAAESAFGRARLALRVAWAAIASVVLGVVRRRPRGQSATSGMAVASATFAAVATIGGLTLSPWGGPEQRPGVVHRTVAPVTWPEPGDVTSAQRSAIRPLPAPTPGRQARLPAGTAGSSQIILQARPVGSRGPSVTVTRSDGKETMLQTLERCLREGPVITSRYIGCPAQ